MHPVALALGFEGDVYVLDAAGPRIRRWSLAKTKGRTKDIPLPPADNTTAMCRLGDALVVAGLRDDAVLHEYDVTGRQLLAFGRPFTVTADDPPLAKRLLDEEIVACDSGSRQIFVAAARLPMVRAYSANGKIAWEHELRDAHTPRIERQGGGLVFGVPPGGAAQIGAVVVLGAGVLAVQIRREETNPAREPAIDTRYLSLADGQELGRQTGLPLYPRCCRGEIVFGKGAAESPCGCHTV